MLVSLFYGLQVDYKQKKENQLLRSMGLVCSNRNIYNIALLDIFIMQNMFYFIVYYLAFFDIIIMQICTSQTGCVQFSKVIVKINTLLQNPLAIEIYDG